jgi:hypothetical protein
VSRMQSMFQRVHRVKPDASRKTSSELFLVGINRHDGVSKWKRLDKFYLLYPAPSFSCIV